VVEKGIPLKTADIDFPAKSPEDENPLRFLHN
jgi:hypothetical protein